jgi:hypothetical protein
LIDAPLRFLVPLLPLQKAPQATLSCRRPTARPFAPLHVHRPRRSRELGSVIQNVEVMVAPGGGYGLRATRDLPSGAAVVSAAPATWLNASGVVARSRIGPVVQRLEEEQAEEWVATNGLGALVLVRQRVEGGGLEGAVAAGSSLDCILVQHAPSTPCERW